MFKRKTPQEYYNECKERGLDLPIENYINAKTKIKHKCNKGHIYLQSPKNHTQGYGCYLCKGKAKKNTKQYYEECKQKGLDLPNEEYINSYTKIEHKCSNGHTYMQKPNDHLHQHGCPYCSKNHKFTPKEYYDKCKEMDLDLPIENYVNSSTPIKHKCSKCDIIYLQAPTIHLNGNGCYFCNEEK